MNYLAGDSVFDNSSYARPSVIEQMGPGARLLARDGAVLADVPRQAAVEHFPGDALIISVGGNDALPFKDSLFDRGLGTDLVLSEIGAYVSRFEREYVEMLAEIRSRGWKRVVACTIYDGRFESWEQGAISAAVRIFDDAIARAVRAVAGMIGGVTLLDLRDVFTDAEDYANPIEPSARGGEKLVKAIRTAVGA